MVENGQTECVTIQLAANYIEQKFVTYFLISANKVSIEQTTSSLQANIYSCFRHTATVYKIDKIYILVRDWLNLEKERV